MSALPPKADIGTRPRNVRFVNSRHSGHWWILLIVCRGRRSSSRGTTMKLPRREFLYLAAGAAALPAVTRIAGAQSYPTRPVHIIVGYAPGGATDIMARLVG